jgi:hypothetical protein
MDISFDLRIDGFSENTFINEKNKSAAIQCGERK